MNDRGFTLVEMLVTLVLVGIVVMLTFSIYSYQNKSFDLSERQSKVQWNARMAKTNIQNEIRNATYVYMYGSLADVPSLDTTERLIYVNDGKKIMLRVNGTDQPLIANADSNVEMSLNFEKKTDNLLEIDVSAVDGDAACNLNADFHLPKTKKDGDTGVTPVFLGAATTGKVILYKPVLQTSE